MSNTSPNVETSKEEAKPTHGYSRNVIITCRCMYSYDKFLSSLITGDGLVLTADVLGYLRQFSIFYFMVCFTDGHKLHRKLLCYNCVFREMCVIWTGLRNLHLGGIHIC